MPSDAVDADLWDASLIVKLNALLIDVCDKCNVDTGFVAVSLSQIETRKVQQCINDLRKHIAQTLDSREDSGLIRRDGYSFRIDFRPDAPASRPAADVQHSPASATRTHSDRSLTDTAPSGTVSPLEQKDTAAGTESTGTSDTQLVSSVAHVLEIGNGEIPSTHAARSLALILETFDEVRTAFNERLRILIDAAAKGGAAPSTFISECDEIVRKLESGLAFDLDEWLDALSGRRFPVEHAQDEIRAIRRVVEFSGRELLFEGQPASISANVHELRRNAAIRIVTLGVRPQKVLYHKTYFPPLRSRPAQK